MIDRIMSVCLNLGMKGSGKPKIDGKAGGLLCDVMNNWRNIYLQMHAL